MTINNESYSEKLQSATVDIISDKIKSFLSQVGVEKRDVIRFSLSCEEKIIM